MSDSTPPPQPARLKPVFWVGLALVVVGGIGVASVSGGNANKLAKTVDSAPQEEAFELKADASGRVVALGAKVGDQIPEDQELIFLNDEKEQTALDRAQTALQAAASEIKTEDVAVALPAQGTITGVIVPGRTPVPNPGPHVRPRGPVTALPSVEGSGKQIEVGGGNSPEPDAAPEEPAVDKAAIKKKIAAAEAEIKEIDAKIENAKSEGGESEMAIATLKANADNAQREADRKQSMLVQGAISANEANSARVAAQMAKTNYETAKQKQGSAAEVIAGYQSQRDQALGRKEVAEQQLATAESAPKAKPRPQPRAPRIVSTTPAPRIPQPGRVIVKRSAPKAIPTRVDVDINKKLSLDQQLTSARAKVDAAEEAILARRIRAPKGLRLLEILVKPGEEVKPGMVVARFTRVPKLDAPEPEPFFETIFKVAVEFQKLTNAPQKP
jgi:multidrug resistance efflux pump